MNPGHRRQPQIIRLLAFSSLTLLAGRATLAEAQVASCVPCLVIGPDAAGLSTTGELASGSLLPDEVLRTATFILGVVRDASWRMRVRRYPALGVGVEVAGPLRTLWSVEWGYGLQARRLDGGRGAHTARITVYRGF